MQHEFIKRAAFQVVQDLLVGRCAQCDGRHGLGLAPGEHGRTVDPGEIARLHGYVADGVGLPAVGAGPGIEYLGPRKPVDNLFHQGLYLEPDRFVIRKQQCHFFEQGVPGLGDAVLKEFFRGMCVQQLFNGRLAFGLDRGFDLGPYYGRRDRGLRLAAGFAQLYLQAAELIDLRLAEFHGGDEVGVGYLFAPAFAHQYALERAGDNEFHLGALALLLSRVEDEFAVHFAYPGGGHGAVEGDVGDHHGRGGRVNGQHVGIVLTVAGHHQRYHLRLGVEIFREQRP